MKKRVVVLTGAGISAESGLKTFRDSGGLWENHSIEDVAHINGWNKNPELVLQFYNERRAKAFYAEANAGHFGLVELENYFEVKIITQNVDGLHEKAGSSNVIHLHGELSKVRSSRNENLIYDIEDKTIEIGDLAEDSAQLRPHIVWFGEMVPMIEIAAEECSKADIFVVIGTSLQVYPAAGLMDYVPKNTPKFIVDPQASEVSKQSRKIVCIQETATLGVPKLVKLLVDEYQ